MGRVRRLDSWDDGGDWRDGKVVEIREKWRLWMSERWEECGG